MAAAEWVRLAAPGPGQTGWRRAAFQWIDEESGQRLRLFLEGPQDLLERLEEQGFEPLTDHPRVAGGRVAEGRAELEL